MKIVHEQRQMQLVACGTVCDRCGAMQFDDSGSGEPAGPPPYVTVTVDRGQRLGMLRGHFCPACDQVLQASTNAWIPHLRSVSCMTPDGSHRGHRYQVRDAATGEPRWIESLLADDDMM